MVCHSKFDSFLMTVGPQIYLMTSCLSSQGYHTMGIGEIFHLDTDRYRLVFTDSTGCESVNSEL